MGLVPSCPVTWNTRRSVVTSSSRVVFPSVILAYVSSQIICVVAARLLQCFVGMSGSIFIQQFSISIKKQSTQFSMFLNSLHFHPPLEARGLELYHLPDQIKELLYAANLLPSFLCFFSRYRGFQKKQKNTNTFKSNASPVVNTIVVCDLQTRKERSSRKSLSLEQHKTFHPHRHGNKHQEPLSSPSTESTHTLYKLDPNAINPTMHLAQHHHKCAVYTK